MVSRLLASAALVACAGSAMASSTVYTDLASFLANTQPGFFLNDFTSVPTGEVPSLNASGNGFAYTITATGPGTGTLFNDPGIVSTNSATDAILVTFTGAAVTAIAGNFWASDISFFPTGTNVVINLSDGTNVNFPTTGPNTFRGFTSNVAITSMTIDAPESPSNAWATMDNFYVGAVIPAPGAVAMLGLAGLVANRRRR